MERRLAAILAADVVGFSRLVGADEEGTLHELRRRRVLIDDQVAAHHGRVFGSAGDSVVVEFASPVEAVRCAIDIQHDMAERNAKLPVEQHLEWRIGINLGDVVVHEGDLLGDGVNVAARLESLAAPGGICVSEDVHRHVDGKSDIAFQDIGMQQLKNIARLVRVYRVETTDDSKTHRSATVSSSAARTSIAVLPFANLSADSDQEYFSEGLTADLITALAHWHSFDVIAHSSSFSFKDKAISSIQTAHELGARYLLEGSVRRCEPRVRITAQLIDVDSGHHLWVDKYDRELGDIFDIQDDIVQRIAAVVAPELAKAELQRATSKKPEDLNAWDLCLQGMALIRRERTAQSHRKAREYFERALAIRPDYSDAHTGLAMTYNMDILIGVAEDRVATANQAMTAARIAITCDEFSAWAHHELSTAYQWLGRFDDALAEARAAVALNPSDAYALHALGNKSDLAGDPAGIAHMEKAQALNPADAQLHTHLTFLARAYVNTGQFDLAVRRARQAIRRCPNHVPAHFILALALGQLDARDLANAELKTCEELSPGFVQKRRDWHPYKERTSNDRLRDYLDQIIEDH